jgi:uncharacterized membrane protein YjdF
VIELSKPPVVCTSELDVVIGALSLTVVAVMELAAATDAADWVVPVLPVVALLVMMKMDL